MADVTQFTLGLGLCDNVEVVEEALDRREKIKRRNEWFKDMQAKNGFLYPVPLVAELLGVSRQRVNELVAKGHLKLEKIRTYSYITEVSLDTYVNAELKAGRPPKVRTEADALKMAVGLSKVL